MWGKLIKGATDFLPIPNNPVAIVGVIGLAVSGWLWWGKHSAENDLVACQLENQTIRAESAALIAAGQAEAIEDRQAIEDTEEIAQDEVRAVVDEESRKVNAQIRQLRNQVNALKKSTDWADVTLPDPVVAIVCQPARPGGAPGCARGVLHDPGAARGTDKPATRPNTGRSDQRRVINGIQRSSTDNQHGQHSPADNSDVPRTVAEVCRDAKLRNVQLTNTDGTPFNCPESI